MNKIAKVLGGRYELDRLIGIGGMAKVYLAHDRILNRHVAVKVLHEDTASDPRFVERFRREAHAAAGLNHPNIVAIYDWHEDEEDGRPLYYMVMEHVPGKNLKELIQERGPLPEAEALGIACQVAQALAAAHARGVIHRDVKPHNILIDPSGQAKVADFGIARAAGASQLTKTNMLCGTAQYLSPEQAQRRPIDGRSDVYSLGIVLYEMLSGREPFDGDSPIEVAMQHITADPRPVRELRPDILAGTEVVVSKALAKDPALRYQSANDLRVALERARKLVNERDETTTPGLVVQSVKPEPLERQRTARVPLVPAPAPPVERKPRAMPEDTGSKSWSRWLMAVPVLLLLAVAGGVFAMGHHGAHSASTLPPPTGTPHTAKRTSGQGHVTSRPTVQTHRSASHAGNHKPVRQSPPVVAGQVASTATSAPAPTSVSVPVHGAVIPPATATPGAPVSIAASGSGGAGPVQAVLSFYQMVSAHQFSAAAGLWSPAMQSAYAPEVYINNRFGGTRSISVQNPTVVSQSSDHATVALSMVETLNDGSQQTWSGSWQLVKIGASWFLNSPNLH